MYNTAKAAIVMGAIWGSISVGGMLLGKYTGYHGPQPHINKQEYEAYRQKEIALSLRDIRLLKKAEVCMETKACDPMIYINQTSD